jgi:prolyl oligopeptidase
MHRVSFLVAVFGERAMFRGLLHSALFFLAILTILTTGAAVGICSLPPSPALAPPRPVIDHYFAMSVADPYYYMENLADPEVHAWMHAQNDYTGRVLASIPGREAPRPNQVAR